MFFTLFFVFSSVFAQTSQEIVHQLNEFTKTRESLAATLEKRKEPITEETFKQVCAPVGMSLKNWADTKGFKARQVAAKYRNPKNAPTPEEAKILEAFAKDAKLASKIEGSRVYVPIRVVQGCLHCHGDKESRPDFIKSKYKEDLAFGFKPGDLRGMYTVQTQ